VSFIDNVYIKEYIDRKKQVYDRDFIDIITEDMDFMIREKRMVLPLVFMFI